VTRAWRYFLTFLDEDAPEDPEAEADAGRAAVFRLAEGAPKAMLEVLSYPDEHWEKSDLMLRATWRGPDEYVTEISPARYHELMALWVANGRLRSLPPDESPSPEPEA
jgi:hypothetical protein